MGSRTIPVECEHGKVIDWGDFGPDPVDGSVGAEGCVICMGLDPEPPEPTTPEWLQMFVLFVRLNPSLPADHIVIERAFNAYLATLGPPPSNARSAE